ncbi:hypothetical protein LT679_18530 [Mucilaginibacter roseus]|uniref:Uncharacterized protein n=1 Tax=Mucilaginibacter roseus TaxID=1528868 RepID=A0ABS8U979_9SPHI|nr:hypothetical protein [Mucilaginibacter roseus]MCD8742614.1 hypothetical protein [Mucilaginibacter roseus]
MNLKLLFLPVTFLIVVFGLQNNSHQYKPTDITNNINADTTLRKVDLGMSNLTISIPRYYELTKQQGTDYWIFKFKPKNNQDRLSPKGGVYLGNFPKRDLYPNDCPVNRQMIWALGQFETLDIKRCTSHYYTQVIIQNTDNTNWYEKIQLFGEARSDKDLQSLLSIMKSISRKNIEIKK